MEYSVYIDILFFINLMINTVILTSCATVLRAEFSAARIFAGAVIGALYACVMFYPELKFLYTVFFKIIAAGVISLVAFKPKTALQLIKYTAVFFAITVIFGMVALAILYFSDVGIRLGGVISNGVFYFDVPLLYVLISCAASYAVIIFGDKYLKGRKIKSFAHITLVANGKSVSLKALVDTGNLLKDPFSGKSVMIAELSSVSPLFDTELKNLALQNGEYENLPRGFRLVPFSSIGKQNGLIPAFCPDKVFAESHETQNIIVAVHNGYLSQSRDYDALISPDAISDRKD